MKANEAPEKIYINDFGSELSYDWHTEHCCESDIEYTRTDAFIEKACNVLAKMVWEITYEDLEGDSVQHYDKMEFIDEFKKYMKGE